MKKRIRWMDAARFIGIFCIYLGHLGAPVGLSYTFVFTFHVPLFFLLSGCSEALSAELPWKAYLVKNLKRIMIPFFFFSLLSLAVFTLLLNSHTHLSEEFRIILLGDIRNQYFAGALWFLSCLFIVKMIFFALRRLVSKWIQGGWAVLLLCLGLYVCSITVMESPVISPRWPYNIDSALYYSVFFAIGYYAFPWLQRLLSWDRPFKKVICGISFVVLALYTVYLFFGKDALTFLWNIPGLSLSRGLLRPLVVIGFVLLLAKLIEDIPCFLRLGQDTLYLCGSEYMIKFFFTSCLQLIGLDLHLVHPVAGYLYTFLLLALCQYTLVPLEKAMLRKLTPEKNRLSPCTEQKDTPL